MKKNTVIIISIILASLLQGCGNLKNNSQLKNEKKEVSDLSDKNEDSSQLSFLKQCLTNSEELSKLNEKYKGEHVKIIHLINEAKSYAATNLSENINRTIRPFFEYKINYECNKVSQNLIDELRNRILDASNTSDDKK
jgi:hypothetical protein